MARKKGYKEMIAEHIAEVVETRQIKEILHFTRLANLPTILERGLLTRSELKDADFTVFVNDDERRDKEDDAVSVSISCYYPKMFYAKRHGAGDEPWAILMIDPSLLWNHPCRFYQRSTLSNATNYETGARNGGWALEKLFDDCSLRWPDQTGFRDECGLPPSWPTFSDAEVQVMSAIDPRYILGAWVETPGHSEYLRSAFDAAGRRDYEMRVNAFRPRIACKPHYWG